MYAQLKEIYNIAAKIARFLINCKILVARNTEKQTLLLAVYKHVPNRRLWKKILSVKLRKKICLFIR